MADSAFLSLLHVVTDYFKGKPPIGLQVQTGGYL